MKNERSYIDMFDRLKEKFTKREEESDMVFKPLDESAKDEVPSTKGVL